MFTEHPSDAAPTAVVEMKTNSSEEINKVRRLSVSTENQAVEMDDNYEYVL